MPRRSSVGAAAGARGAVVVDPDPGTAPLAVGATMGLEATALRGGLQCRDREVCCGQGAERDEPCRSGHGREHEPVEAAQYGSGDQLTQRPRLAGVGGSQCPQ